ncbi:YuiA family protein [Calditerricola satsumensis]|uniref:Uncharacterized protein n=1 Tax=Calditerricola satsumensis TaxID=373054 RepID=A0A8J3FBK0_9BACI|nr:hypothetical protein GCM10007043_18900 [Calditerricola satsumensis]
MRVLTTTCAFCQGNGYVHLLLGGTERCHMCGGTGQLEEEDDDGRRHLRHLGREEQANYGRCCS